MSRIRISHEFFAKAKNDYNDWTFAIIREFVQNSVDAGSKRIEFRIDSDGDTTSMQVINDGKPMTKSILVDKLLSLGSSGKDFSGENVGGFGKAKEILYFVHNNYSIRTGDMLVTGQGAEYDLTEGLDFVDGVTSTIKTDGDHAHSLIEAVKEMAKYSQFKAVLVVNGREFKAEMRKGSPRSDFGWSKVYTNKQDSNMVAVRINGILMFTNYVDFPGCVVLELTGDSAKTMTSNRDGLKWDFRSQFNTFLVDLTTNRNKALGGKQISYTRYAGKKLGDREYNGQEQIIGEAVEAMTAAFSGSSQEIVDDVLVRTCSLDTEFTIKDETGMNTPRYYLPEGEMSGYAKKLAVIWTKLMLQMHRTFGRTETFGVGFIFSSDAEAQYERSSDYGKIYYLNPAKVVSNGSGGRSMKKRFKLTERDRLVMIALHEFIHGSNMHGCDTHGEVYANVLTDYAAKVMANRKDFNWCFAG